MSNKKHKKHNQKQNKIQDKQEALSGVQVAGQQSMPVEVQNAEAKLKQQKAEEKAEEKTGQKAEQKAEEKAEQKAEEKPEEKTEQKAEQTPEEKNEQKAEQKAEEKSNQKAEQKPDRELQQQQDHKTEKKGTKKVYLALVILLAIILALVVAGLLWYGHRVDYYQEHYLQNTYINEMDCSEMTPKEVAQLLDQQAREYSLVITGRNEQGEKITLGTVTGQEINMALTDALGATEDILLYQDEWWWIKSLQGDSYSYSIQQGVIFDDELLRGKLTGMEALQEDNMIAPTDAYIGEFSEEEGAYKLVAHTAGTTLDVESVITYAKAAIYGNQTSVDLEDLGCYIQPEITTEDKTLLKNLEEINRWLKTDITYDWNGFEVKVDTNVIKKWVSLEDGEPVMDQEAIAEFVEENAQQYDTYGKSRTVTTTLGAKKTLPSGAFGWKTDRWAETAELIDLIEKGAVTEREPVYSSKAPVKGMNDIGRSYVEADLTNQHLYLYYKGNLVLETDFVSGDMRVSGNITPQGVFGLTYKTKNAVLRGANYETPVSYWMPFHGNFGMHDATWRSEFGGDIYLTNGSHGCLNLPLDKAAELYSYLYTGYPVICYY